MAKEIQGSLFGSVKGLVAAHNAVKDKPGEVGDSRLPAGIENGVAELRGLSLSINEKEGKYKGKTMFTAWGVALSPNYIKDDKDNIIPVKGGRTNHIPIYIADMTDGQGVVHPASEQYDKMLNTLKVLGLDVASIIPPKNLSEAQAAAFIEKKLIEGMNELVKQRPTFKFRTWKGKDQIIVEDKGFFYVENEDGTSRRPGKFKSREEAAKTYPYAGKSSLVNHVWGELCEFESQVAQGGEIDDELGADVEPNVPVDEEPEAKMETPETNEFNLDKLLQQTASDDPSEAQDARNALLAIAESLDIKDAVEKSDSWEEAVEMIRQAQEGQEGSGQQAEKEEDAAWVPAKGEVYMYQPLDSKGKPAKNPTTKKVLPKVRIKITAVDLKAETVDAIDPNKNVFKRIPFSQLEGEDAAF